MTVVELDELEGRKYVDISIGLNGDRWALSADEGVDGLFGKAYRLYYRKPKSNWESSSKYVTWVTATGNGKCWYGTRTSIVEYDHNTGKGISRVANLSISGSSIDDVAITKSGNVWLADRSKNNLWEWNGTIWEQRPGSPDRIAVTDDNRRWAIIGGRLQEWDGSSWINVNINAVDIDSSYEGNLWAIRIQFGQQVVSRLVDGEWEDIVAVSNAIGIKRDKLHDVVWVKSNSLYWSRIEIPFDWGDLMTREQIPRSSN